MGETIKLEFDDFTDKEISNEKDIKVVEQFDLKPVEEFIEQEDGPRNHKDIMIKLDAVNHKIEPDKFNETVDPLIKEYIQAMETTADTFKKPEQLENFSQNLKTICEMEEDLIKDIIIKTDFQKEIQEIKKNLAQYYVDTIQEPGSNIYNLGQVSYVLKESHQNSRTTPYKGRNRLETRGLDTSPMIKQIEKIWMDQLMENERNFLEKLDGFALQNNLNLENTPENMSGFTLKCLIDAQINFTLKEMEKSFGAENAIKQGIENLEKIREIYHDNSQAQNQASDGIAKIKATQQTAQQTSQQ